MTRMTDPNVDRSEEVNDPNLSPKGQDELLSSSTSSSSSASEDELDPALALFEKSATLSSTTRTPMKRKSYSLRQKIKIVEKYAGEKLVEIEKKIGIFLIILLLNVILKNFLLT